MARRPDHGPSACRRADSRRWRRQPEARPQQIIEAARRIFGRKGYFGATLDDVAREAGITKGTIYLYYPNKQAVFGETIRAYAEEVMGEVRGADAPGGHPLAARDLVRGLVTGAYRVFRRPEYQAMVRLVIGEAGRFPEEMEALYHGVILKRLEEVARVFESAMARGEIRRMDPLLLARTFQAMVWGFLIVQESLRGGAAHPWSEAAIVDHFTTVLWEGVRP